ncbi:MAG: hypothetical protein Fur0025_19370 [Oscillatoriaceae cyanobacterium]
MTGGRGDGGDGVTGGRGDGVTGSPQVSTASPKKFARIPLTPQVSLYIIKNTGVTMSRYASMRHNVSFAMNRQQRREIYCPSDTPNSLVRE